MWRAFDRSIRGPLRASIASRQERRAARDDARHRSYERLTYDVLREERTLDIATLIERVASEALHAAQVSGGADLDIAVWGPSVFHREADAAVRRMIGRTLVLEADGPGILVAPMMRVPFQAPRPAVRAPGALGLS